MTPLAGLAVGDAVGTTLEFKRTGSTPGVDVNKASREIAGLSMALADTQRQPTALRNKTVRGLHDRGLTLRDIGVITGLSHQRVDQLLE